MLQLAMTGLLHGSVEGLLCVHKKMLSCWEETKLMFVLGSRSLRAKELRVQMMWSTVILFWRALVLKLMPRFVSELIMGSNSRDLSPSIRRSKCEHTHFHTKNEKVVLIFLTVGCTVCKRLDMKMTYQSAMFSCDPFKRRAQKTLALHLILKTAKIRQPVRSLLFFLYRNI